MKKQHEQRFQTKKYQAMNPGLNATQTDGGLLQLYDSSGNLRVANNSNMKRSPGRN
jgi:hypothetical protein